MKPFNTSLLYVLSGTGNTFRVARWIEDYFEKNANILSIATRGALWFGPVKIPGAAGFANFFAALVLLLNR